MCHKIQFNDFDKALKTMQFLNRNKGFELKRIYLCPECGTWHHTSKEIKY